MYTLRHFLVDMFLLAVIGWPWAVFMWFRTLVWKGMM